MIDTVIFDIVDVLAGINWQKSFQNIFDPKTAEAVAKAMIFNAEVWKVIDRGIASDEEILGMCTREAPELESEIRRAYMEIISYAKPFDYSESWLRSLKQKGYRVYILSNFGRSHFREASKKFDFLKYADGRIISFEVHKIKPEKEIYALLCERYGITPQNAVFIDDKLENVEAAREFGLNAVLFTDKGQAETELEKMGVKRDIA